MLFIDYSQHHRFDRSARLAKQGETHSPPAIPDLDKYLKNTTRQCAIKK